MQLGRKSKEGLRVFIRQNGIIIADKNGKPRVIVGAAGEDKNVLRSGKPSTFNQLGKSS